MDEAMGYNVTMKSATTLRGCGASGKRSAARWRLSAGWPDIGLSDLANLAASRPRCAAIKSRTTDNVLIYRMANKPAFGPLGYLLNHSVVPCGSIGIASRRG
jgi:hypothetical protein